MNGMEIEQKKLIVEAFKNKEKNVNRFTNVFVKNLPERVKTKEDLDDLFKDIGKRTSVAIFPKEIEGKQRFYGFLNFETSDQAAEAVKKMDQKEIDGGKLFVTKALTKDQYEREKASRKFNERAKSRKFTLFIKSSSDTPLSEQLVKEELNQFGEIKSITIPKQKYDEGQTVLSAIGYVVFAREDDAAKV
jgi:polyadenylate-binding protein